MTEPRNVWKEIDDYHALTERMRQLEEDAYERILERIALEFVRLVEIGVYPKTRRAFTVYKNHKLKEVFPDQE